MDHETHDPRGGNHLVGGGFGELDVAAARIGDHAAVVVPTVGRCDIPAGTTALALTVTVTQPLAAAAQLRSSLQSK
mgnify:CR=1 FL=1